MNEVFIKVFYCMLGFFLCCVQVKYLGFTP